MEGWGSSSIGILIKRNNEGVLCQRLRQQLGSLSALWMKNCSGEKELVKVKRETVVGVLEYKYGSSSSTSLEAVQIWK